MARTRDAAVIAGVLVSLKPEFASAVAEGRKKVELRRRFPAVEPGVRLVIYSTQPVGALVGSAPIEAIDCAPLSTLWRKHRRRVGLTKERFDDYFASRTRGYAVILGKFEPMGPLEVTTVTSFIPGFHPPQSWRYLSADVLAALRASGDDTRALAAGSTRAGARYHAGGVV